MPAGRGGSAASVRGMTPTLSTIERLERAAESDAGVRFVGSSMIDERGPVVVTWRQIHDEARAVGAALQAQGLCPATTWRCSGPTSRELMTIVRGCWMAGIASMVLPLPMRMGSPRRVRREHASAHPPRRRQARVDRRPARRLLRRRAPAIRRSSRCGRVLPGAPNVPGGRRARDCRRPIPNGSSSCSTPAARRASRRA